MEAKRRRGRPTLGKRMPLGLRVTPETKRQLDAAAKQTGRSLSQEAEFRLDRSFEYDLLQEHHSSLQAQMGKMEAEFKETTAGLVRSLLRALQRLERIEAELRPYTEAAVDAREKR